jgi:hypothetical protein
MSLKERCDLLFNHGNVFSFLFKFSNVQDKSQLIINYNRLRKNLSANDSLSHIDATLLKRTIWETEVQAKLLLTVRFLKN